MAILRVCSANDLLSGLINTCSSLLKPFEYFLLLAKKEILTKGPRY